MSDHVKEYGIKLRRIRNLYLATAIVGSITGLMILLTPSLAGKFLGFPGQLPETDPVVFGLVGAFWLGAAAMALFGLRAPLQFLPIFLLQLVYKCAWFLLVFAPLVVRGEFPIYGIIIAAGNALWIFLDVRAIPFRYLLRQQTVDELQSGGGHALAAGTLQPILDEAVTVAN